MAVAGNNRPQCSRPAVDPFISSSGLLPGHWVLSSLLLSLLGQSFTTAGSRFAVQLLLRKARWLIGTWAQPNGKKDFKEPVQWTLNILTTNLQPRPPRRKRESEARLLLRQGLCNDIFHAFNKPPYY